MTETQLSTDGTKAVAEKVQPVIETPQTAEVVEAKTSPEFQTLIDGSDKYGALITKIDAIENDTEPKDGEGVLNVVRADVKTRKDEVAEILKDFGDPKDFSKQRLFDSLVDAQGVPHDELPQNEDVTIEARGSHFVYKVTGDQTKYKFLCKCLDIQHSGNLLDTFHTRLQCRSSIGPPSPTSRVYGFDATVLYDDKKVAVLSQSSTETRALTAIRQHRLAQAYKEDAYFDVERTPLTDSASLLTKTSEALVLATGSDTMDLSYFDASLTEYTSILSTQAINVMRIKILTSHSPSVDLQPIHDGFLALDQVLIQQIRLIEIADNEKDQSERVSSVRSIFRKLDSDKQQLIRKLSAISEQVQTLGSPYVNTETNPEESWGAVAMGLAEPKDHVIALEDMIKVRNILNANVDDGEIREFLLHDPKGSKYQLREVLHNGSREISSEDMRDILIRITNLSNKYRARQAFGYAEIIAECRNFGQALRKVDARRQEYLREVGTIRVEIDAATDKEKRLIAERATLKQLDKDGPKAQEAATRKAPTATPIAKSEQSKPKWKFWDK